MSDENEIQESEIEETEIQESEIPEPEMQASDNQGSLRLLEAVIFASAHPLPLNILQQQLGKNVDVPALLKKLQEHYSQHGVNLVEIDGLWGFRTAPDLASLMKITRQPRRKLPRAAAEVLAIIAYHQPITRGEIESIRGVETSKGTLDILLELGWIRPGKRRETPGQPLNWHTTSEFLSHFNITTLQELPGLDDLKAAGLLDTRPVLNEIAREKDGKDEAAEDEDDFSAWITEDAEEEPEKAAVAE